MSGPQRGRFVFREKEFNAIKIRNFLGYLVTNNHNKWGC